MLALDASPEMVAEAQARFAGDGRVQVVQADLLQSLPLDEPVDAILSTATFHWVLDHDLLFANLAAAIRPGGRMSAQCGGEGNLASIVAALPEKAASVYYAGPEDTVARLERAGFVDAQAWLQPEPTPFPDPERLRTYLRTIVLRTYVDGLPQEAADDLINRVAASVPEQVLDYVRLNIVARRS